MPTASIRRGLHVLPAIDSRVLFAANQTGTAGQVLSSCSLFGGEIDLAVKALTLIWL